LTLSVSQILLETSSGQSCKSLHLTSGKRLFSLHFCRSMAHPLNRAWACKETQ
jgi:hypothetical protein